MQSMAREDYLKSLWKLGSKNVANQELANHLGVTPASATNMIQKLSKEGLVDYIPYKGASLTGKGVKEALSVVRRHRLLESFLSKTLDLSREDLHVEAERLEHALSKELEHEIAKYLGNPIRDPHGHPIPGPNGEIYTNDDLLLSKSPINESLMIRQVPDSNSEILAWLEFNGMVPGAQIIIVSKNQFDGGMAANINNKIIHISTTVSNLVYVSIE